MRCDAVRRVCMWVLAAVKWRRTCCLQSRVGLRHGTESWRLPEVRGWAEARRRRDGDTMERMGQRRTGQDRAEAN